MGLVDLIKGSWRKKFFKALYEYELHSGQANSMADNPDAYLKQGYAGNTSVYSIINRIDNMRKQAELKLYKKNSDGKNEEVTGHELNRFLVKVNKFTTTDDYITAHLTYLLTIGEFFTYKPQLTSGANKGKVPELFELPSGDVEIIEGTMFDPIKGYRVEDSKTIFEPYEVYQSKLFNPNAIDENSMHGLSPLRAASKTVTKLNQIETTQLKQIENQSPPYILFKEVSSTGNLIDSNQNRLTTEQRAELVKDIKKSSSDKTRGLPLVVKDKMGKLELGSNLADMELINASQEGIVALCGIYGMPPELFGYGQKTYNNMGTARKSAWTDCIMPYLDRVKQTLNECLIEPVESYSDYFYAFDYSDVEELQDGIKDKVEWMVKAGWAKNEIREATGKTPDENPLMDEPVIQMGESFLSDYSNVLEGDEKSFEDYK